MKSFLFSIFFFVVSFSSISQEASVDSKTLFEQSITDGAINMTLPSSVTVGDVEIYSKYYTTYFATNFDASSHKVTFTMVNNDAKSRRVIMRFLGANKIQTVLVEGQVFLMTDFYNAFLK
ncbi:hypothetical protein N9E11_04570 [Crocinitomicaceae bacterium]|nr:hypothetical protein [Crocinitomicaceae bacterium]